MCDVAKVFLVSNASILQDTCELLYVLPYCLFAPASYLLGVPHSGTIEFPFWRSLFPLGALTDRRDSLGLTPLDRAEATGDLAIIEALKSGRQDAAGPNA